MADFRQRSQTVACCIEQCPQEAGTGELERPPNLILRPALRFRYRWKGQKERPVGEIGTGDDILDAVKNDGTSGVEQRLVLVGVELANGKARAEASVSSLPDPSRCDRR